MGKKLVVRPTVAEHDHELNLTVRHATRST
jgi:hypothetical protein